MHRADRLFARLPTFFLAAPTLLALLAACAASGPATGARTPRAVEPGQLFPGKILNVHAPQSAGWILLEESQHFLVFSRMGNEPSDTYIARVGLFPVPKATDRGQFEELVAERAVKDEHPENSTLKLIEMRHEISDARGYPCAKYRILYEDTDARTSRNTHGSLTTQALSEYCQNPTAYGNGFYINYSHRGPDVHGMDPEIEMQAESFFEGIQIPAE